MEYERDKYDEGFKEGFKKGFDDALITFKQILSDLIKQRKEIS